MDEMQLHWSMASHYQDREGEKVVCSNLRPIGLLTEPSMCLSVVPVNQLVLHELKRKLEGNQRTVMAEFEGWMNLSNRIAISATVDSVQMKLLDRALVLVRFEDMPFALKPFADMAWFALVAVALNWDAPAQEDLALMVLLLGNTALLFDRLAF